MTIPNPTEQPLVIDGSTLSPLTVAMYARTPGSSVVIAESARIAVERARASVERWIAEGRVVYGMTTGFGEFANVMIPAEDVELLQENLVISHSAGMGPLLPAEVVRAMMILRVNALCKGHSGIRLSTLDTLVAAINAGLVPDIPMHGSVGSSGDLAPLSHLALALIGRGSIGGESSAEVLLQHGIQPVRLAAKEGLALINGTQMMSAYGCLALADSIRLADTADVAGALSADALRCTDHAFDDRLHAVRPHRGQRQSAQNLRLLLKGSEIRESHREGDGRVQDAYSIRCMPQVHGATRDAIDHAYSVVECEINSATDNPLIFPDDDIHLEGGNFHGQPLALVLDYLAIAMAELANISERRTERLVNSSLSGLPRFLTPNGGLNSGMMIAQYTAASMVSENKVLAHPASVDSIPTSANQEDHNSMGSISARKLSQIIANVQRVIAIEVLCACQAVDLLRPLQSSAPLEAVVSAVRLHVPFAKTDRVLYLDMAAVCNLVASGAIVDAAGVTSTTNTIL